ncbi:MAG: DUF192 domain-containing protein [Candidatus Nanoarchaeia archaeon]|nr:DUF192 domain-containing protein [Candidatus Nanoarchaeia archaeon]
MKIKINNKNVDFELCNTFYENCKGLMFSKKKNIILTTKGDSRVNTSIHSFFVFFPFNAIFVNSKKEVVDHKKMYPFSMYMPKRAAKYVIETYEDIKHLDKKLKF